MTDVTQMQMITFCVAFTKHFGWYGGWNGIMPMVYMGVMAGKISFLWEISECCV